MSKYKYYYTGIDSLQLMRKRINEMLYILDLSTQKESLTNLLV